MNCAELKLTSHDQYLKLLKLLEREATIIEIVQINGDDQNDPIIKAAQPYIIRKQNVNQWLGTLRKGAGVPKYTLRAEKPFFGFLQRYEGVFFNEMDKRGCDTVRETDFGQDDIAFFNRKGEPLFYTTTHEGYAAIGVRLKADG